MKTKKKPDVYAKAAREIKAQIAARVAPAPRPKNVIKKVYKEGSPGALRKEKGVTLTQLKKIVNDETAVVTVMLDVQGNPTGEEHTVLVRDTAVCTKRRRMYTGRNLLGRTKYARRKELRAIAIARKARRKAKAYGTTAKVAAPVVAKKGRK